MQRSMFGSAVIGGDVLDIGSRKAEMGTRRQRGVGASSLGPAPLVLGAPGQFDVPNVEDVRRIMNILLWVSCRGVCMLTFVIYCLSLHCTVARTLRLPLETRTPAKRSSLPRVPLLLPSSLMVVLLSVSTLVLPWELTLPLEL